ncbi:DUF3592 domain-containing protein [Emticicia sp. TH156]|uniref:DUF3592 domain-containing protein n=1 Tax=Emticicia sp. TH156 TaxID=2067454 RepID=UPI000C77DF2D|nr:DUF3592 domain-containing protein [Emticicia sp. TH156]PLK44212.1 hypothetical protein C0V77_10450 [Emticicia sp. TH156]
MRLKKKETSKRNNFSLKFYFDLLIVILVVGYPIYFLIRSGVANYQLANEGKIVKAVVIDERNYVGKTPGEHRFFYSYEFILDGKAYRGNTRNTRYHIGDSVDVRYSISNPSFNEIVKDEE